MYDPQLPILNMKVLVTGGAGFVGSHAAEYYANAGDDVVVYDNLSRAKLLQQNDTNARHNWEYLSARKGIAMVEGDVRDYDLLKPYVADADVILHTAGQTAVTTSVTDPEPDFMVNALGTFNVLEAARASGEQKTIVFCSTNKVYGDNVNDVELVEGEKRYDFAGTYANGIPESFDIDLCKHTPYGCSKLTADLYMQDWARLYGHRIGVFRMSCIYGTRQFGFEDQGWVAWFTIAAMKGFPVTIFGDGKQVRDVLYVTDLVELYDRFVRSDVPHGVYNTGGGVDHTLSLLELIDLLESRLDRKIPVTYDDWRPSDQKVYISDTTASRAAFDWTPAIGPAEGVEKLVQWVLDNPDLW